MEEENSTFKQRTVVVGKGSVVGTNNSLYTSKYTLWTFFPIVSFLYLFCICDKIQGSFTNFGQVRKV